MKSRKFDLSGDQGATNGEHMNWLLLILRMEHQEHNMYYDADAEIATVIWNGPDVAEKPRTT